MVTEVQFLNKIISAKDYSAVLDNNITCELFPNTSSEFKFIDRHYKQYGEVPDMVTMIKNFPDFEACEVDVSFEYLINELHREYEKGFLAATFNKVRDALMNDKVEDCENVLLSAATKLSGTKKLEAVNILDDISRYDAYVDKCNDFGKYYISTGFKELDEIIGGFDRNEELAVIAARSGVGKSWMLLNFVKAAADQGLTVGVFSGEMTVNKVAYRYDTLRSHISNGQLLHGNSLAANQYKTYIDNLKANHKGSVYILTRDMIPGTCGVNALRGFIEKYDLDILFVDQLSLLDDDRKARVPYEIMANISKDLKILQTNKHIPIISVSQQNRTAIEEGKSAGTENIAGADRIAQDSTLILFLAQKDNILTMSIGKSRDGGTGSTLKYDVDLDKGYYTYMSSNDEDEDDAYGARQTDDYSEGRVF